MLVEIELALHAAEPSDIDDAAEDLGRFGDSDLVYHAAGDQIDDQIDAVAAGRLLHFGRPIGVAGVEREVGAVFLEAVPGAPHWSRCR